MFVGAQQRPCGQAAVVWDAVQAWANGVPPPAAQPGVGTLSELKAQLLLSGAVLRGSSEPARSCSPSQGGGPAEAANAAAENVGS